MFTLGYVPHGEEYAGRMSIPYSTPSGVVQIKYRCANLQHGDHKGDSCPKYLYEAGCGMHLWNARVLINAVDTVVVTEGELDAITVQAYTGVPAVAYPGTKTWDAQAHFRLCFEGISEVVVVADGDKPGRESARRVAESIGSHARVVDLGDGEDSNSFITTHSASAFLDKIGS